MWDWIKRLYAKWPAVAAVALLIHVLAVGLLWEAVGVKETALLKGISGRDAEGAYLGQLPAPTAPSLTDPVFKLVQQKPQYKLMVIRHIPAIERGVPMPHPFVGDCVQCHLIVGGAKAGTQPKTPVGAVLEDISNYIIKVGPPLLPTSQRPHPAAGRCIKCHDIVVKVPIKKKSGVSWFN